jgi:NADH:ubiquinone oxidoreductase subunit E
MASEHGLDELLAEFAPGKGHVLPALHKVQEHYGYLSREAIGAVARRLNTTAAMVFGAASYYSDFRFTSPPQTRVDWCSGPACRLKGGDRIREALEATFELPLGGQSDDGRYGLRVGQCNGTCSEAPQIWLNGEVVGQLTVARAIRVARDIKAAP